ncbi:hypothetical protein KABACHOK_03430 [Brevundimonas phage vB_BpoS-Kabachok]|uniref:Uncharacterized protein n=2 Tax=Marchewkavirus TaxID=3425052 RepID=A0A9E7MQF5_9CAUD|nr:hypothetical protein KABACHOK_03430 [Brevundimonas phage vB_BpoS-Kabachok]USN14874.1 hypothetical protein DOMOVOI_04000 [Brevundimonas phage vB_BpoS-Domovoi]
MHPGFYVVRMPKNGAGSRLIVESRPFRKIAWIEAEEPGYARRQAESWRDFVQDEHPKDDVFVIEREGPMDESPRPPRRTD